ncbi:hypothetical protein [Acinetobacter sp. P1(2025)]|uniref:hypothetical protein n=1 Tax=Acinetobacter sp. P1(2025) TaxID=3446120 RepID=UPI003F535A8C
MQNNTLYELTSEDELGKNGIPKELNDLINTSLKITQLHDEIDQLISDGALQAMHRQEKSKIAKYNYELNRDIASSFKKAKQVVLKKLEDYKSLERWLATYIMRNETLLAHTLNKISEHEKKLAEIKGKTEQSPADINELNYLVFSLKSLYLIKSSIETTIVSAKQKLGNFKMLEMKVGFWVTNYDLLQTKPEVQKIINNLSDVNKISVLEYAPAWLSVIATIFLILSLSSFSLSDSTSYSPTDRYLQDKNKVSQLNIPSIIENTQVELLTPSEKEAYNKIKNTLPTVVYNYQLSQKIAINELDSSGHISSNEKTLLENNQLITQQLIALNKKGKIQKATMNIYNYLRQSNTTFNIALGKEKPDQHDSNGFTVFTAWAFFSSCIGALIFYVQSLLGKRKTKKIQKLLETKT